MNDVLVSVAMATYNGSKYLKAQLDSILNQTYKHIEIVIVDDYSTDETVAIIKEYIKRFPFIKLYQNENNLGVTRSFARAMSFCSGDYIALSDQDDVWFENKLERLLNNIGDNLLIHSDAVVVDENLHEIAKSSFTFSKKDRYKEQFVDYLISNSVTGCTALFPKKLLELAMPIPEGFYIHDYYLALIASFYGRVKLLDEPLVYYRQHGANSIGAKRSSFKQFMEHCKVLYDSYNALLTKEYFRDNPNIKLLRDYRLSIYLGEWTSKYSIFRLLKLKGGIKLFIYYVFLFGQLNPKLLKMIYNFVHKIDKDV